MGHIVANVVPNAIGIAMSPLPVVVVIPALFSERPTVASIAFVAGWFGALLAVPAIGIVMAIAGVVLIARSMHATEAPTTPAWMSRVERAAPATVFAGFVAAMKGVGRLVD